MASSPSRRRRLALGRALTSERAENLRAKVVAGLAADQDAAAKLPKAAEEMTADELEKTLSWLRNRAKRQA